MLTSGFSTADGEWHLFTSTYAAGIGGRLYLDGSIVARGDSTTAEQVEAEVLRLVVQRDDLVDRVVGARAERSVVVERAGSTGHAVRQGEDRPAGVAASGLDAERIAPRIG